MIKKFYRERVGMSMWLEQEDCVILKHGNMLLGFCQRAEEDIGGIVTVFYESRAEVDQAYQRFEDLAEGEPKLNPKYGIYHFFTADPEGRKVEFQSFSHPLKPHLGGDELLLTRRSVRKFKKEPVGAAGLAALFETCRWAPTSMNSQSYYFIPIKEREDLEFCASVRSPSSDPIARAPMAVAICSDPALSKRHVQDGCIAAYHLLLAARTLGLGTCWIAAMDRNDVKERLGIPQDHYVATVTPLGWPAERPEAPGRKTAEKYLRDM